MVINSFIIAKEYEKFINENFQELLQKKQTFTISHLDTQDTTKGQTNLIEDYMKEEGDNPF